jgi:hypothetical protein
MGKILKSMKFEERGIGDMEWISVEKRLPEPYEKVLVYEKYMDDIPVTAYLSKNKIWVPYDEHFSVYGDGEIMNCFEQKNITHWMPLPDPPK